jgi:hypothetical protein
MGILRFYNVGSIITDAGIPLTASSCHLDRSLYRGVDIIHSHNFAKLPDS